MSNRPRRSRSCAHCGRRFVVNPRVGKRHRFCSHPACARASRRVAQQKWLKHWLEQSGGEPYFSGETNAENVRAWRARHPQYWKRTDGRKRRPRAALRLTGRLKSAMTCVALQDTIAPRLALEIGIISRLSGATLQDAIAGEIRATMLRGYAILHGKRFPRAQ